MTEPQDSTTTYAHPDGSRCCHDEHGAGTVESHRGSLAVVRFDSGVAHYVAEAELQSHPGDLFDAAEAAQEAADATGVSHHVRKERATGQLVVQPTTPVDGRRFLTVWGPAEPSDPHGHLAHARYLGADAALAAASGLTMSEADAISILDGDGDPEVLERYPEPALSPWEEACSQTLASMLDVLVATEAHAAAWEQGRDGCWSDAVEAFAYRLLGNIPMALAIEASNEAYVASLRTAAGL